MADRGTSGQGTRELRLAVLLSGTGRTLENLIGVIDRRELPATIVQVITSRRDARGNGIARQAGIPLVAIERRLFASVDAFSRAIYRVLEPWDVDLVVMAGFLCKISIHPDFEGRIMNIHPSLLPLFGGKGLYGDRVHQAVLDAGMKVTGCTVHFVDEHYDAGPIILQACVPVLENDIARSLAIRVFAEERRLYPEAIRLFAAGRLRISGRRVRILPQSDGSNGNPA
jgi:phosphoribosylglycinamide formyltransferase-1